MPLDGHYKRCANVNIYIFPQLYMLVKLYVTRWKHSVLFLCCYFNSPSASITRFYFLFVKKSISCFNRWESFEESDKYLRICIWNQIVYIGKETIQAACCAKIGRLARLMCVVANWPNRTRLLSNGLRNAGRHALMMFGTCLANCSSVGDDH